ncbi:oogenesis-related [Vanacampus margaritifer]
MAMQDEPRSETVALPDSTEGDVLVKRHGVLRSVLRGLFWPFGIVVHAYHGFWWVLGFRRPKQQQLQVVTSASSPVRQCLIGRKRLHPVTRLLLTILPRWVQGALGYPLSTAIGCSLSPEIRVSPTKPCGKGSKRKQDDLDDDDEDEEHQTWVEVLTQEEIVDEGSEDDPDYEPSSEETDSEEFHFHNTESDPEGHDDKGMVVIEDVEMGVQLPTPSQAPCPAL